MSVMLEEKIAFMGATYVESGVLFRVWAPKARAVTVVGEFNEWTPNTNPLEREDGGYWYAKVEAPEVDDEYKFQVTDGENSFDRIDHELESPDGE